MKRSPFVAVALCLAIGPLAIASCGPDKPEASTPPPTPSSTAWAGGEPTSSATATGSATTTASVEAPPALPPVEVSDMAASPDPKPLPTIKITAPANEAAIDKEKAKDFEVKLDGKNWDAKKGSNHFHLILDNQPYKPIYDTKAPVKLSELAGKDGELAEGQHILFAFPSRATHESVKGKGAMSMVTFWVGKKGAKPTIDTKKPMLIYSRPKGDNFGAMAQSVMLDFYLVNTTLTDGSKVRYTVTGLGIDKPVTGEFTAWAPKIFKNLQKGEFDFKLELLDKDGKVSDNPLNTTTRHIKVDATTPMDPSMGMAPGESPAPATSASAAPSASAKKGK